MKLKDMTEASGAGPSRQLGKVRWAKCVRPVSYDEATCGGQLSLL